MRLVVILSSASFAVFGACLTLPGTLLPVLVPQFEMRLVEAGSMLAFQPAAYLVAVMFAARILQRIGMRAFLIGSVITFAFGMAGFGCISTWRGGAALLFLTGLGLGLMEVGINSLLIVVGGPRRTNLLNFTHLFFGVGSFVAPALSAHAVAAGASWRLPFWIVGGITAAVALGWSLLPVSAAPPAAAQGSRPAGRARLVLLLATGLGVYVGTETGIGAWLTKYMVTVREVGLIYAGNTLSLYWLSLAVGRLLLSLLAHRVREEPLLVGLAMLSLAGVAAALTAPLPLGAALGFALTGFGLSGIFPGIIALGGRYYPDDVARVTSHLIAGAGAGGIVIPWLMSAIAERAGLIAGMTSYGVGCALMTLLAVLILSEPVRQ